MFRKLFIGALVAPIAVPLALCAVGAYAVLVVLYMVGRPREGGAT